jgi:PAS domain S-box-containing protein
MDVAVSAGESGQDRVGFAVVGVVASAGNPEALTAFLGGLPPDCLAAVVVFEADAPATSLPGLLVLAGAGPLPVVAAGDGTGLGPGIISVPPPGGDWVVEQGTLRLSPLGAAAEPMDRADHFLASLARSCGSAAVAILLSGPVGAAGARAIRAAGGLVLADRTEADGLEGTTLWPAGAGVADAVLPAAAIGPALAQLLPRLRLTAADAANTGADPGEERALARMRQLLFEQTGHDVQGYKASTLLRRLRKHMLLSGSPNLAVYLDVLAADAGERTRLFDDLLIGVTTFFRDPEAFGLLAEQALPDILRRLEPGEVMRAWVAGCATGEEAYSLAMLLAEQPDIRSGRRDIKLFATDLDAKALETARKGVYPAKLAAAIGPRRLEAFSRISGESCAMGRELRDSMVFAAHNLLRDPPFLGMDLVVCRNFLIYLNASAQARVLSIFAHALRPGGYLLLGPAENLGPAQGFFDVVDKKWRLFRRKASAAAAVLPSRLSRFAAPLPEAGEFKPPPSLPPQEPEGLAEAALLARYAHPAVLVTPEGRVARLIGDLNAYLELGPGSPSLVIGKLARKTLRPCVREVLVAVLADGAEHVRGPAALAERPGEGVMVRGLPVADAWGHAAYVLIVFEGLAQVTPAPTPPILPDDSLTILVGRYEAALERMADDRDKAVSRYETLTEELRASNEELVSTNEELQTSNEEMDASREELQSLNEELTFVNAELQHKIEELAEARGFVENLLAATNIATLVLDAALVVTRFTPAATELFHLVDTDVGRAVGQIKTTFDASWLLDDCRRVLVGGGILEREVHCEGGRWFLMRAYPFCSPDGGITGVVLTFGEVTALKEAEEILRRGKAELEVLVARRTEELREKVRLLDLAPVMVRDLDGRITYWNSGATRLFGYTAEQALGRVSWDLLHTEFPQPVETITEELLRQGHWAGELRKRAADGRVVELAVSWVLNRDAASRPVSVLEVANDVTERNRLWEQARRWDRVFENAEFGLAHVNATDNTFIEVNRAFARQRGYEPEELVGLPLFRLIPEEDRARVGQAVAGFDATGHGIVETEHVRKDGSRFPVLVEVTTLRDASGATVSRVAYALDISERKQAEEALRDMARFPGENPNPVLRISPDLTVIFANQPSQHILAALGGAVGRPVPEALRPLAETALEKAVRASGEIAVGSRLFDFFVQPVPGRGYVNAYGLDITERKQAEAALAASEARYHGLFEAMGEGVCLLAMERGADGRVTDYRILDINPGYCAILGVAREQAQGASVLALFQVDTPPNLDVYERIVATGRPESFDTYFAALHKHLRVSAMRTGPDQFAVVFEDVTTRVEAIEALSRSEERLRQLVEAAPDAIMVQSEGRFALVNQAAARLFGASGPEELLGRDIVSLMHPDSRELVQQRIRAVNEGRIPQPLVELRYQRLDGEFISVEAVAVPFDHQGKPASLVFSRDITERLRAAEEKRRQAALGEAVARIQGAYVAGQTSEGIFLVALAEVLAMTGSRYGFVAELAEDERGRPCQRCLAVADLAWDDAAKRHVASSLAQGVLFPGLEGLQAAAVVSADVVIANHPITDAPASGRWPPEHPPLDNFMGMPLIHGRECIGSIGLANSQDGYDDVRAASIRPMADACAQIIERMRVDRRLVAAKKAAEAASRSKSEFLANMSHEIRTPLNGVLGMLQLLGATDLDTEQTEYVDNAVKSSKRLTRLLSDILDLSLVESGRLVIRQEPVAPADLREAVLDLFNLPTREKGLSLTVTIHPRLPEKLCSDEARLRQILFNLVGNAVKFTDVGGVSVDLSPASLGHDAVLRLLVSVSDTGIGIADNELGGIFEPFGQVEGVYVRRFGGAGLGLSIVRRLVRLMGGEIAVDSEEGRGTTMYVCLPLGRLATAPEAAATLAVPPLGRRGLRLLLAEDDAVSLMSFARMLEKAGHTVDVAENGAEAVARLAERSYDCILMDVQMPVMDGVAATRAIRDNASFGLKAAVPIVAMTAYAMAGDREKFLAAGMNDYVSKPVDARELERVLARVLAGRV